MQKPAQPVPSTAPPSGGDGQAAGSAALAEAVAGAALQRLKQQKPGADPAKKWEEMGGELFDAVEKRDRAAFGKLFAQQVKIAVKEALRGNQ